MSPHVLTSTAVKTLLALLHVYARDGRATVRTVAAARGRSVSTTHYQLVNLMDAGFVEWEPDLSGTLRPLVGAVR